MANVKFNGLVTLAGGATANANRIQNVGAPTENSDAATKSYVDAAVANVEQNPTFEGNITLDGGTVTGLGTPTNDSDAANKGYVDTAVDGVNSDINQINTDITNIENGTTALPYLKTAGGTMTGAIAMGNNKVTGLGAPTDGGDAANKTYVDSAIANVSGDININGGTIENVGTPTNPGDATNKEYVDGQITEIKELVEYPNATASRTGTTVAITGPADAGMIIFNAPAAWTEGDSYTYNGSAITLTDLNGEAVQDGWASGSPIMFLLKGAQAFFKAGGGGGGGTYPVDGEIHVAVADSVENLPQGSYLYTIGCITNTQPSKITIQCEPPESPANGDIFIDIGSLKPTEKGIPLGNGLVKATVYVLNAYQWNGTEWVIIKTYLRQESGWVDCATEIYTYGNVNQEFTGGLSAFGKVTINDNQNGLIKMNQGNGEDDFFRTNSAVNWGNFNTVYFIAVQGERNRTGRVVLYYYSSATSTTARATKVNEVAVSGNVDNQVYQIATNFVTGNYYLYMGCYVSGSTLFTYCDISRIYLI